MKTAKIACTICDRFFPEQGVEFRCSECGGVYDYTAFPRFDPTVTRTPQNGIWRYQHSFGIPSSYESITLGEGDTPLIPVKLSGRVVYFKCEFQNPTGSFKDRGSALIMTWMAARGIKRIVEDSSGNAGASIAYYAARSEIKATIFIPERASGPKKKQIEASGAEVTLVRGERINATDAAIQKIDHQTAYASHAWLPMNIPGYATVVYEIYEQLGNQIPGSLLLPVGQGGLMLGAARGIKNLRVAMKLRNNTALYGVQTKGCAPLWEKSMGRPGMSPGLYDRPSLAEGIQVNRPVRGDIIVKEVMDTGGGFSLVDDSEIEEGASELARMGFYVEPTSATVLPALMRLLNVLPDPIVVILTGSGLKVG